MTNATDPKNTPPPPSLLVGCVLLGPRQFRDLVALGWIVSGRGPGARLLGYDIGIGARLRRGLGKPSRTLAILKGSY